MEEAQWVIKVKATSYAKAIAKLFDEMEGLDCSCGLPQWGQDTAQGLKDQGLKVSEHLCMCIGDEEEYQ